MVSLIWLKISVHAGLQTCNVCQVVHLGVIKHCYSSRKVKERKIRRSIYDFDLNTSMILSCLYLYNTFSNNVTKLFKKQIKPTRQDSLIQHEKGCEHKEKELGIQIKKCKQHDELKQRLWGCPPWPNIMLMHSLKTAVMAASGFVQPWRQTSSDDL